MIENSFINIDPNTLWKQLDCLQQYSGKELFGLEESYTKNLIQSLYIPNCTLDEWNDNEKMNCIFNYHLKRRLSTHINWSKLFYQWLKESTIIELQTSLTVLYPFNHKINDRELRAWKAMLRAVGCVEITPFNKEQSEVCEKNNIITYNCTNFFCF